MPRCGPGSDEGDWLGWLDVIDAQLRDMPSLNEFAAEVRAQGFSDVLLLGMGGSSLGPEVLAETLGSAPGFPTLHVLDSTDPQQVKSFERKIDLSAHAVHRVEQIRHDARAERADGIFLRQGVRLPIGGADAARHFVAITDPGSQLEKIAKQRGFHRVFHGIPSIGGRYSVLSPFGIVPLAAMGRDVRAFLESARIMARSCGPEVPPAQNPGVELGLAIGVAGAGGRDKVTIVALAVARVVRRLGRAIARRVDRQARQGRHPDRGRAAGRSVRL